MRSERGRYRGEALRAVAMPLGGLGTGTIALAGDGSLRQWQIHNQINHLACVPAFLLRRLGTNPSSRSTSPSPACCSRPRSTTPTARTAPPTSNDHVVPSAHRELLREIARRRGDRIHRRIPDRRADLPRRRAAARVSMEAFNPFVPLRSEDSGIPAILFNLTVDQPDGSGRARLGRGDTAERGWLGRRRADHRHQLPALRRKQSTACSASASRRSSRWAMPGCRTTTRAGARWPSPLTIRMRPISPSGTTCAPSGTISRRMAA